MYSCMHLEPRPLAAPGLALHLCCFVLFGVTCICHILLIL